MKGNLPSHRHTWAWCGALREFKVCLCGAVKIKTATQWNIIEPKRRNRGYARRESKKWEAKERR